MACLSWLHVEAESAAKRVAGVIAVANDIEVRIPSIHQRPDPDIARDAAAAIKNYLPIFYEQIKAVVKDGWVTLRRSRVAVPAAGSGNCSSSTARGQRRHQLDQNQTARQTVRH